MQDNLLLSLIGVKDKMDNSIKLTVVIPVFNCEKYLQRCLESVVNQSLKNIKIIIINDASTDKTAEVINKFKSQNNKILVITNKVNKGTGQSRNMGITITDSEYITFLDADDWVDTNTYKKMVSVLDETKADIAVCGVKTEYISTYNSIKRYTYNSDNIIDGKFALHLLSHTNTQDIYISPMPGNKIIRTKFMKENKLLFPQRSFCEDDELFFKAFYQAHKVAIVPDVYHHYFQREDSAMHLFSKKHIDDFITCFKEINKFSRLINDDEIKKDYYSFFKKTLLSLLNTLFCSEQKAANQREYLKYLYEQINDNFSIAEYIEYFDLMDIKKYLL